MGDRCCPLPVLSTKKIQQRNWKPSVRELNSFRKDLSLLLKFPIHMLDFMKLGCEYEMGNLWVR